MSHSREWNQLAMAFLGSELGSELYVAGRVDGAGHSLDSEGGLTTAPDRVRLDTVRSVSALSLPVHSAESDGCDGSVEPPSSFLRDLWEGFDGTL